MLSGLHADRTVLLFVCLAGETELYDQSSKYRQRL
jgi:hypothetical protein